jgi:hypothetical protein
MRPRFRPSPAMIVACIALFVALGGTATAVTYVVSSNSQIGPNTVSGHKPPSGDHANVIPGSVNGQDVADNSLHGADIVESTLGQVPSAAKANDAFSTFHDGDLHMPDTLNSVNNPIGSLSIPHPGSYVIIATLAAYNKDNTNLETNHDSECVLAAGGDSDTKTTDPLVHLHRAPSLTLQVVHSFDSAGPVTLSCTDNGHGDVRAQNTKITAIQVNNLTNSGF